MESKWAMFKASIVGVAARSYGQKVIGAYCGGNLRTHWWTPAKEEVIKLKKEAFQAWLDQGSPEMTDRYQLAIRAVEPLLLHVERGQLKWFGHLIRIPPFRGFPGTSNW